jgi:hypothetical protein
VFWGPDGGVAEILAVTGFSIDWIGAIASVARSGMVFKNRWMEYYLEHASAMEVYVASRNDGAVCSGIIQNTTRWVGADASEAQRVLNLLRGYWVLLRGIWPIADVAMLLGWPFGKPRGAVW